MALERLSEFRTELSHIGFIGFDSAFAVIRIRPPSSPLNLIEEPRTEAYSAPWIMMAYAVQRPRTN
ncbi:hypothetical protein ABZX51_004383 [Aspergillus tubingensis]